MSGRPDEAAPVAHALERALNAGTCDLKALVVDVFHRKEMRHLIADDFTVVDRDALARAVDRHAHQPAGKALEFNEFVAEPLDQFNNFRSASGHSIEDAIKQKKMGTTAHPYAPSVRGTPCIDCRRQDRCHRV